MFELVAPFKPAAEQPLVIEKLADGLDCFARQTLLGVTGSGKTFILANVINKVQRPALILAPNKTLAAQLYGEMKQFFPKNSVEMFVSYYDYYQPEAYVAATDTFIEKDASVNAHIEQMRLSATKSILTRKDCIIVATVSAIYGLGDPVSYLKMVLHLQVGDVVDRKAMFNKLASMQYTRNDVELKRGTFRVKGELIEIHPAESEKYAIRLDLFDADLEKIVIFDPLTGEVKKETARFTVYPKTHYATPEDVVKDAVEKIKLELESRVKWFKDNDFLLEAQRIEQRVNYDLEMLNYCGFCNGVENYSRYFSNINPGDPPPTLMNYLPDDVIVLVDESHVTLSQLGGMVKGDQARKKNLIDHGFRLPSAADNRPLTFNEFDNLCKQAIFVSATPGDYELDVCKNVVECLIRPTGLVDPQVELRPATGQVEDCLGEILSNKDLNIRFLITTLTKKMAEQLADYLSSKSIKVRYLHSDIDTVERVEILQDLRKGVFDVLVGINLLREGLDLPEVGRVFIFDADKEGFLRSKRSLIQTIGRAARNINGKAILYADTVTKSIHQTIEETSRRRDVQLAYNSSNNITPASTIRDFQDVLDVGEKEKDVLPCKDYTDLSIKQASVLISKLEGKMYKAANELDFETAASLRDEIGLIEKQCFM